MFMNKQAITFLSLFTLILVLSIYYLLVPPIDQGDTVSTKSLSRIEILQSELNKNHENKKEALAYFPMHRTSLSLQLI